MLESVVQMSRLDRFGEVLEAEVVEAFSALLRHYCAWAVVTLDFDWSNGLSKDDDLEEVVEDNDYDWSDKKSIVLLEKSFLVEKSISLFELVRVVETGLNRMFHNRHNQFDLMMILEFLSSKTFSSSSMVRASSSTSVAASVRVTISFCLA